MAHQTPLTSFKKRPRSIRLALAELFSGRVSARLAQLEERVFDLEVRANAQATTIANLGTIIAVDKAGDSAKSRKHTGKSNGKFSKKASDANGLRTNYGFSGCGSSSSRSEPVDTGFNHYHHTIVDDTPSRESVCHSGWDVSGHDSGSSCDFGSSSCSD
ncbi:MULTISPECIES: hypothetical protein [Cronobacter]|uniref:hypothetical protein n=1 Tax=Cronobacter TaxID=413496 RepID=UPI00131A2818|nr:MULTISPECIES: hypothetical protein [Cronobacter]AXW99300.2 hypothetical protein CsakCS931_35445 [Cronobacter sakazakii]ELY4529034.1 hypothetical protein [Cronobacter sakazakii]MDK1067000.1 hypothetical protein [Cronobacter sakazakii]